MEPRGDEGSVVVLQYIKEKTLGENYKEASRLIFVKSTQLEISWK
jgi:hypothetical protein